MPITITRDQRVVMIHLNRPEKKNALNSALMTSLLAALHGLDRDRSVGCFVLTGAKDFFSAGADIKEMHCKSAVDLMHEDYFNGWEGFAALRTPRIAAVSGMALGGGCELAMMCDIIFAADNAQFALPEITLGVMPGMGGSQRLTRLVGKVKAMDMILTGRSMDAVEAERHGLVARVIPQASLIGETLSAAHQIAEFSKCATIAARDAVNQAEEVGLRDGILFERRTFHALFATQDQQEGMQACRHAGMQAFIEKRTPDFQHK